MTVEDILEARVFRRWGWLSWDKIVVGGIGWTWIGVVGWKGTAEARQARIVERGDIPGKLWLSRGIWSGLLWKGLLRGGLTWVGCGDENNALGSEIVSLTV